MVSTDNTKVAFIGTGIMGSAMAGNILSAGYQLTVFNRTKSKASDLIARGAAWADSIAEACLDADVVFTMVAYPEDVEDAYLGERGIIDSARPGSYLVDLTTSSPKLAREIYAMGAVNDLHVLDCPVTGGDVGARKGTLTFFVGGERADLAEVTPLLDRMGKTISYQGEAGMGQMAKLANQVALAGSMVGAFEAMAFAKQTGLDPASLREILMGGSASSWVLNNLVPRALADDFTPGFFVEHFLKDMGIALDVADDLNLTLPGLETAYQLYDLLSIVGGSDLGVQSISLLYEDEATCSRHGLDWSRAEDYQNYDDDGYDDYDDDDDDPPRRDPNGGQDHHHRGGSGIPGMDGFFSAN